MICRPSLFYMLIRQRVQRREDQQSWIFGSNTRNCTLIIWKVRCRALISGASDIVLRFFDHEAPLQRRRFGLEP